MNHITSPRRGKTASYVPIVGAALSFVFSFARPRVDLLGTNSTRIWPVDRSAGASIIVRVPSDCVTDANCILSPPYCAVGIEFPGEV